MAFQASNARGKQSCKHQLAKIRIWTCLQINSFMHALCCLRKPPWGLKHSSWHRLLHRPCFSRPVAFPVSSSEYAGENHQWKNKRFTFYRDFLAHSRDLDLFHCPARSHGLIYTNCWAGRWGTAGLQRECCGCHSIWAGEVVTGRCGCNVTEEAASPSPPSQECHVTSLEPGPARQQGHPAAPPRWTGSSALKGTTATEKKSSCSASVEPSPPSLEILVFLTVPVGRRQKTSVWNDDKDFAATGV